MARSEDLNLNVNVKGADAARRDIDRVADEADDLDRKKVEVEITADDKASKVLDNVTDKAGQLPGIFGQIGGALGGTGGLAAGAAGLAAGLGAAALHASDLAIEADQIANFTGASVEDASALQAVLRDTSSVQMADLLDVVAQMSGVLAESPELAAQLGVNLADAKNPLDQMVMVIDALNASQLGSQEKLVLGAKLFGEEGVRQVNEITAALEGPLAGAIADVGEGRIISNEDVEDARQFKEQWAEFQATLDTIAIQLGQSILPLLAKGVTLVNTLIGTPLDPNTVWGADEWTAAFDQWISEADDVQDKLNEFEAQGGVLDNLISGTLTATDVMAAMKAGIPVNEFQKMQTAVAGVPPELVEIARTGGFASRGLDLVATSLDGVSDAADVVPRSIDEVNAALLAQDHAAEAATQNWRVLMKDMEDGEINTIGATIALQNLQTSLKLSNEDMDKLIANKFDDHMADVAAAEEEAAAAARELAAAVAEATATIADINVDDIDNMGDALQGVLDVADRPLDFEILKANLLAGIGELQKLVDEQGSLDWNVALAGVRDQFQTGIVESFRLGGRPAAEAFTTEFVSQLAAATGLSPEEIYGLVGLPPDGSVEAKLRLVGTEESKADAERILNNLKGVDPNNPIIAYIMAALQTGGVDPVIGEIAALLLAQELGVPVAPELLAFTPEQIAAAHTVLAEAGLVATVDTEADTEGATDDIAEVEEGDYQATIEALAETQEAARQLLDETTRQRQATIYAIAAITSAKAALDSLTDHRTAKITADAETAAAENELNRVARDRQSRIFVRTVSTGSTGGGGPTAEPGMVTPGMAPAAASMAFGAEGEEDVGVAALTSPAMLTAGSSTGVAVVSTTPPTVVNNLAVTVQAAVIGNRHEVERTVAKALRSYTRLNGSRN